MLTMFKYSFTFLPPIPDLRTSRDQLPCQDSNCLSRLDFTSDGDGGVLTNAKPAPLVSPLPPRSAKTLARRARTTASMRASSVR